MRFLGSGTRSDSAEHMAKMSMLRGSEPKSRLRMPARGRGGRRERHAWLGQTLEKHAADACAGGREGDTRVCGRGRGRAAAVAVAGAPSKHLDMCGCTACTFLVCARISSSSSLDRK